MAMALTYITKQKQIVRHSNKHNGADTGHDKVVNHLNLEQLESRAIDHDDLLQQEDDCQVGKRCA
jgi:hypothetical protein